MKTHRQGTTFGNTLIKRYWAARSSCWSAIAGGNQEVPGVVELFRKYADQYNVDFLLMVAQGYQESRLDQKVKSQVGAIGVMQVMPATGKELKVGDITQLEPNIHAGVKYMRFMIDRYYKDEPMDGSTRACSRSRPTTPGRRGFASCARRREARARSKCLVQQRRGRSPRRRSARETVTYVSNIYKYYVAYRLVIEDMENSRRRSRSPIPKSAEGSHRPLAALSRSALAITDTELNVIAALAQIGLMSRPMNGYSTPAATGTPTAL